MAFSAIANAQVRDELLDLAGFCARVHEERSGGEKGRNKQAPGQQVNLGRRLVGYVETHQPKRAISEPTLNWDSIFKFRNDSTDKSALKISLRSCIVMGVFRTDLQIHCV